MPKEPQPIGGASYLQVRDMAEQLDMDRPRLLARNRRIIMGAVALWAVGVLALGHGFYRLLSAL